MGAVTSSAVTVEPAARLVGRVRVPGDKSMSHRYAMLAALADGTSTLGGYSPGADCRSTLECLRALDVRIDIAAPDAPAGDLTVAVAGRGLASFRAAAGPIDVGNSGTTMRLMAGILSAQPFATVLTGDESLRRRPMQRVIEPLERMGARLAAAHGRPPLTIDGGPLVGIDYVPSIPSAQVKSAVLLAGLHARGTTRVRETVPTRDHTERALAAFGAALVLGPDGIAVTRPSGLRPLETTIPGDPSSAAFWAVAAAVVPDSDVRIEHVGLNPTRTAYLDILRRAGAEVETHTDGTESGEPRGTIRVRARTLAPVTITASEVPALIDELPILGTLGLFGGGFEVSGAAELRHKESDRITAFAAGLRHLGADVEERPDGFRITPRALAGGVADAAGDHRLAMAFAVAALRGRRPSAIEGAGAVDVSYPGFFATLESLRG